MVTAVSPGAPTPHGQPLSWANPFTLPCASSPAPAEHLPSTLVGFVLLPHPHFDLLLALGQALLPKANLRVLSPNPSI